MDLFDERDIAALEGGAYFDLTVFVDVEEIGVLLGSALRIAAWRLACHLVISY